MRPHLVVACLVAFTTGCVAQATPPAPMVVSTPPETVVVAAQPVQGDLLATFAGSYTIQGAPMSDGCAGEVYLAARNITVDATTSSLYADVVNRTYAASVVDGQLVAEGRFVTSSACPGSTIFERWTMALNTAGHLQGTLQSLWLLPPTCSNPCQIQFHIVAHRR